MCHSRYPVYVLLTVISAGCTPSAEQGQLGGGDIGDDVGSPVLMRVERFAVAEGERMTVSANTQVIAEEGIDIAGDIEIEFGPGDIEFIAENGDIEVSGTIRVMNGGEAKSSVRAQVTSSTPQNGPSIVLRALRADINMKRFTLLQSGDGQSAQDFILNATVSSLAATSGAKGGNIVLYAPLGVVRLPPDRRAGDPPLFGLGNGGRGANLTVARDGFVDTGESTMELHGGNGGDSGELLFDSDSVVGVPTPANMIGDLIEGGAGGAGGYVLWDNDGLEHLGSGVYPFLGLPIPSNYPPSSNLRLQQIILEGGTGGAGARLGGQGAWSAYFGRKMNEIGSVVAAVFVYGGNGGDAFASPVPVRHVQGGDGGEFHVLGNDGWDGALGPDGKVYNDGADSGDVLAQGGNGGEVFDDVMFVTAKGGDGGMSKASQNRPGARFGSLLGGANSGSGGRGKNECMSGCPGGDGGSGGRLTLIGGDGGDAPSGSGAVAGDGGDVWSAWFPLFRQDLAPGIFARGGDGNPPGKGGCAGEPEITPGHGGAGSVLGAEGEFLQTDPTFAGECSVDGAQCGEDIEGECDESEVPPAPPPQCQDGDTLTAISRAYTSQGLGSEIVEFATYDSVFGLQLTGGWVTERGVTRNLDPETAVLRVISQASRPFCESDQIQWADQGGIVNTYGNAIPGLRAEIYLRGCTTIDPEYRASQSCCYSATLDRWSPCGGTIGGGP